MKKSFLAFLALFCAVTCLCACSIDPMPTEAPTEESMEASAPPTETSATTEPTESAPTTPAHSSYYIPDLSVEDVILYFREVCLDAEFVIDGDPSYLQRWEEPICYTIDGDPTDEDLATLTTFCSWLNTVEGFPGIRESAQPWETNLRIFFCDQEGMINRLGDDFYGMDGGVTFWYDKNNAIYSATVCYLTGIDQNIRNSVILEEIYNGLGPVQDTELRTDSIIYSGYSEPQELTEIDRLILKLLYHPDLQCGMNAQECETIIRQLYY